MVELRARAEEIVASVQKGQRMVLTYRGRPAVRLEPVLPDAIAHDDAFYRLSELAGGSGGSLTNREIDKIVYGA